MQRNLVVAGAGWQVLGIVSGIIGTALFGAVSASFVSTELLVKSIAIGALVHVGYYLSFFFVWLPTTLLVITICILVSERHSEMERNKLAFAVALTIVSAAVAIVLRYTLVPFNPIMIFAYIWLTLIPPIPFVIPFLRGSRGGELR